MGDAVIAIGTTIGRTSGAQKTVCCLNDLNGSWAKADAPSPLEFGRHFVIRAVGDHRFVVASVVHAATKTFSGDVGDFGVLSAFRFRRPPFELRHCVRPIARN